MSDMTKAFTSNETTEQEMVVQYCDLNRIPIVHIPNEGKRTARYGAQLKRAGMRKGFPDLFIPIANHGKHGLFIEMKYGRNRTTPEQDNWIKLLHCSGYAVVVCYGFDDAKKIIDGYCRTGDAQRG